MLRSILALAVGLLIVIVSVHTLAEPSADTPSLRLVSLNPSLTSIVVALGAAESLVGVDDFSAREHEEIAGLPTVGGLFNPSLEAVVALRPQRVLVVPSVEQRAFRSQLEGLGIQVEVFENLHFDEVLENIERIGAIADRREAARHRIAAIRRTRAAVARETAELSHPGAILILQRDPIFVAGKGSFIDEMLVASGAENLASGFEDAYPRVTVEWLLDRAPDVVIDVSTDPVEPFEYWSRWPSLPAVASHRVIRLEPKLVTLPGPYLDRSLRELAIALHGPAIAQAVTGELAIGAAQ